MTQTVDIPAAERGKLHIFSVNLPEETARQLAAAPDAVARLLGVTELQADYAELLRIADLGDMGLNGYLIEGYDVAPRALDGQSVRLAALGGYAMIVLSMAFQDRAVRIDVGPELTYLGAVPTRSADWTPRPPAAKAPGAAPPEPQAHTQRRRPSQAAVMGRVASIVLLVLFLLTALIVWIGG